MKTTTPTKRSILAIALVHVATLDICMYVMPCTSMAEEPPVPAYHNTVYVAPTWDLTTQHPEEIDEAVLRRELAVIKDAFGTGKKHGAYAQPAITLYCTYEGPLVYRLEKDRILLRNLALAVDVGLHYRIILHGGRFTGMDPHEEPLQRFLKTTSDDWLMGDPKPFRKPQEGGETPPYVSISRFNSVYYVRKMRSLDRAVSEILAWIKAKPERMKLFIGFSKDPETSLPPFPGITFDPLSQLEFESWRAGEDIYGAGHVTIPVDHHPNAESISRVVLQTSKGNVSFGDGKFGFIGFGVDTPRYLPFGVVIVDAEDIEGRIEEGSGATYTVKGGRDDGESFESIVWCFSDDPEGDGGEAMVRSAGDEDSDYATFMKAMVDHHIEDVIAVIHRVMVRSGLFRTPAEAREYLYTHEIPGGIWKNKGKGPEGEGEYDYALVSRMCAPLLPDKHGNWSSAAGSRLASPGIDVFGILTRDSEIFDAAAQVSRQFGGTGNWGLMEWNPDSRTGPSAWKESLDFVARYGVHIVSLQGWEEIQKTHNEIARRALADFLVEMGSQPYEPGENNLARRRKQPTKPSSLRR